MEKVTTLALRRYKRDGKKIAALTAYDAPFAKLMDNAGIDIILVGDSLGMTVLGRENTLSVTLDDMVHHTSAVASSAERALVVADMPFMTYNVSVEQAIQNAGRLIKETGAQAVKLEGGKKMAETIEALVDAGIPVMGHVGLLPQSIHKLGGYKVQGKSSKGAMRIIADAKAVEEAGAFSIVIEAVPVDVAEAVTSSLEIPTIGIGAGIGCDGQILVMHDMLGLTDSAPKFAKVFADLRGMAVKAFENYIAEVRKGSFPGAEHSYKKREGIKLKVVGGRDSENKKS